MEKLKRRQFTAEFKIEASKLVLEQGYTCAQAGKHLGVLPKLIREWIAKYQEGKLIAGALTGYAGAAGVRAAAPGSAAAQDGARYLEKSGGVLPSGRASEVRLCSC